MQEAMRRNEQQLQSYFDSVADAVYVLEAGTGRIRNCNERACLDLGYPREELLRLSAHDIEAKLPEGEIATVNQQAAQSRKAPIIRGMHRRKNGTTFPVEIRMSALPRSRPQLLISVVRDVTERMQAETELRRQAQIIDQIHDAVVATDLDGRITGWNKTAGDVFGYAADEVRGRSVAILYPPSERRILRDRLITALKEKGFHRAEVWVRHKSGSRLCVDLSLALLRDEDGTPYGMIGYSKDITAHKREEEQLQFSDAVLSNMTSAVFLVGSDARILYANNAATRILGYSREELLRLKVTDFNPVLTPDVWPQHWRAVKKEGGRTFESPTRAKDGRLLPLEVVVTHLEIRGRESHCVIVRDISERKRVEEALRESEMRYRSLFEQAAEAIVVYDPKTTDILDFNDAACSRLGYTRAEFSRLRLSDIEAQETPAQIRRHVRHIVAVGELVFETRHRTRSGGVLDVEVWPKVVHIGGRTVVQAIWRDITKRKRAEEALQQSEKKYKSLIETTDTGYVILDRKGRVVDANREYVRMTGHRHLKEILGRCVLEWTAPYDRTRNAREVRKCMKAGRVRGLQVDYMGAGKQVVPIEVYATVLPDEKNPQIVTLCRDITQHRLTEAALRKSRDELELRVQERTVRLRALASELTQAEQKERRRLAHVLHEDLQQRLVAVGYRIHSLKESVNQASFSQAADRLLQELDDAVQITRTLTSRLSPPVLYEFGLRAALDWLANDIHDQYGLMVRITDDPAFKLPSDEMQAFAFEAIRELLLNVSKHSGTNTAEIRLRVTRRRQAVVEIRDQGRGMVKTDSTADGFGLFSIRERAEAMGMSFDLTSRPGKGTCARLSLPLPPDS
jgi:PAS domain S-box-containing protein